MATKKRETVQESVATTYLKDQILASKRYLHTRDIVNAVLEDDRGYTLPQVDCLIKEFKEKERA